MKNLIGISGKIGSGKDTVGAIIQYLICLKRDTLTAHQQNFDDFRNSKISNEVQSGFAIKKFADKLKDCVCLLIGCTREQLEDPTFKDAPLGPEWDFKEGFNPMHVSSMGARFIGAVDNPDMAHHSIINMTPRLMLQLLGTEAGRCIIHPNVWVNASFADYKITESYRGGIMKLGDNGMEFTDEVDLGNNAPNWIFTDMRFPNEFNAIKDRGGITIRISRPSGDQKFEGTQEEWKALVKRNNARNAANHASETALDDYSGRMDYNIHNEGSLSELIAQVNVILKHAKVL